MRGFVVIFCLVLASACAPRKATRELFQQGFGECNNGNNTGIADFDVVLQRSSTRKNFFELRIIPVDVPRAGEIIRVGIGGGASGVKELVPATTLRKDKQIFAGYLTNSDIDNYPQIVIAPYDGGQTALSESATGLEVLCPLPVNDVGGTATVN